MKSLVLLLGKKCLLGNTKEEKCSVGFSIGDKAVFDKNGKLPVPSGEITKSDEVLKYIPKPTKKAE